MIKAFFSIFILISTPVFADFADYVEPCAGVLSDLEKLRENTKSTTASINQYASSVSATMGDWANTFDNLVRSKKPIDPSNPNVFLLSKEVNLKNEVAIQNRMNDLNLGLENMLLRFKACQH